MSKLLIVIIVLVVLGILAALGLTLLAILASGAKGPRRFALSAPTNADSFIKAAPWSATVTVDLPESAPEVRQRLQSGPTVGAQPAFSGPVVENGTRTYRGLIATTSRVVDEQPNGVTAAGTGISIPLAVKSYVERWSVEQTPSGSTVTCTLAFSPKFFGFLPIGWTAVFAKPFIRFGIRRAFSA
ncbi:SRPBCC family protein [Gordonia sp. CPCC 205333]|uniref:SRPBCC family protein n=1 Tax=Gordonia sp. CPCC 205333 TaxID=3140790 RepID=UPI003AF35930